MHASACPLARDVSPDCTAPWVGALAGTSQVRRIIRTSLHQNCTPAWSMPKYAIRGALAFSLLATAVYWQSKLETNETENRQEERLSSKVARDRRDGELCKTKLRNCGTELLEAPVVARENLFSGQDFPLKETGNELNLENAEESFFTPDCAVNAHTTLVRQTTERPKASPSGGGVYVGPLLGVEPPDHFVDRSPHRECAPASSEMKCSSQHRYRSWTISRHFMDMPEVSVGQFAVPRIRRRIGPQTASSEREKVGNCPHANPSNAIAINSLEA
ncbi:hypothetical protein CCYA_CCYA12G3368 [Cyanidiococcus yangmingshanensis]|nr:hypothetical protein CCYA_CCYA12G3368 [Cyanidiococcus yangmingshanensis]